MWNLLWETSSPRFPLKSLNLASANSTRNVLENGCLTTAFVNCIKRAYCYATFECFGLCLKWDDSVSVFRLRGRDKICFFVLIWRGGRNSWTDRDEILHSGWYRWRIITHAKFGEDQSRGLEWRGVEFWAFPLICVVAIATLCVAPMMSIRVICILNIHNHHMTHSVSVVLRLMWLTVVVGGVVFWRAVSRPMMCLYVKLCCYAKTRNYVSL